MMALGHAIIFAFGLGWLATLIPGEKVWALGAAPFLWATILKTALAAALMRAAWSVTARPDEAR
jgi:biotin transport system substrate-specific component